MSQYWIGILYSLHIVNATKCRGVSFQCGGLKLQVLSFFTSCRSLALSGFFQLFEIFKNTRKKQSNLKIYIFFLLMCYHQFSIYLFQSFMFFAVFFPMFLSVICKFPLYTDCGLICCFSVCCFISSSNCTNIFHYIFKNICNIFLLCSLSSFYCCSFLVPFLLYLLKIYIIYKYIIYNCYRLW